MACAREGLKVSVKNVENWLAQALSTLPGTPSGPAAFLLELYRDLNSQPT